MWEGVAPAAVVTLIAAAAAGCGSKQQDSDRAADRARDFVRAVAVKDGAAICETLSAGAVRSLKRLATLQQRPRTGCARMVVRQLADFPRRQPGERRSVTSRGDRFDVRLAGVAPLQVVADGDRLGVALFARGELRAGVKRSAGCSRFRATTLDMPLPPDTTRAYPRYLREVARTLAPVTSEIRSAYGTADAAPIETLLRSLRRSARDVTRGRRPTRALVRADSNLRALDRQITYLAESYRGHRQDCGPDPHASASAKEFRRRVEPSCLELIRASAKADGTSASLRRLAADTRRLAESLSSRSLPPMLDRIRDRTARSVGRITALVGDEATALDDGDLDAVDAAVARIQQTVAVADMGMYRLHLRSCRQAAPSIGDGNDVSET